MARQVNETYSNFAANTGPTTATVDVTINWIDDAGTPHSQSYPGETLAAAWGLLSGPDKVELFKLIMRWILRKDVGLDTHL